MWGKQPRAFMCSKVKEPSLSEADKEPTRDVPKNAVDKEPLARLKGGSKRGIWAFAVAPSEVE